MTALMHAAKFGHENCARLLLPTSDALAKTKSGVTASEWARSRRHESLAQFIGAYALAKGEQSALEVAARAGAPRGGAGRRV